LPKEAADDVRLLVSELVTNSFRHSGLGSGDDAVLTVDVDPRRVHVEVEDHGHGFASPRVGGVGVDHGWGLTIVDRVSDRWGVVEDESTLVWFEVDLPGRPAAAAGA
jgi:anti-sigma regulatory factor (Ser/Thr protein kinase)